MSEEPPVHCSKKDCQEEPQFIVEGEILCDEHLVRFFDSTSLFIERYKAVSRK